MTKEENYKKVVKQFAEAAEKCHEAILKGDWRENNKWVKKQVKAFNRIVEIGDIARDELLTLLNDKNLAIATAVATYSLKYDTVQSLVTLKKVAKQTDMLGFRAKQAIDRWEDGDWQLE